MIDWGQADCYYGDHEWQGGGVCIRCGKRLRCDCGCFVREDSIDKHLESCRITALIEAEERGKLQATHG